MPNNNPNFKLINPKVLSPIQCFQYFSRLNLTPNAALHPPPCLFL